LDVESVQRRFTDRLRGISNPEVGKLAIGLSSNVQSVGTYLSKEFEFEFFVEDETPVQRAQTYLRTISEDGLRDVCQKSGEVFSDQSDSYKTVIGKLTEWVIRGELSPNALLATRLVKREQAREERKQKFELEKESKIKVDESLAEKEKERFLSHKKRFQTVQNLTQARVKQQQGRDLELQRIKASYQRFVDAYTEDLEKNYPEYLDPGEGAAYCARALEVFNGFKGQKHADEWINVFKQLNKDFSVKNKELMLAQRQFFELDKLSKKLREPGVLVPDQKRDQSNIFREKLIEFSDSKGIKDIVSQLYRYHSDGEIMGNGGAADGLRHEVRTGKPLYCAQGHYEKILNFFVDLEHCIKHKSDLSVRDQVVVLYLYDDLSQVLDEVYAVKA